MIIRELLMAGAVSSAFALPVGRSETAGVLEDFPTVSREVAIRALEHAKSFDEGFAR